MSPKEAKSAFSPLLPSLKAKLSDILCLQEERTVGNDNCVSYHGKRLQIPPRPHRCHYVRAKVRVHEYEDGAMAIFHGTRRLARYNANGRLLDRAEAGCGTEKRTFHVLRKPDILFAPDIAGCERSLKPPTLPSTRRFMNKPGLGV